jgi:hypothetical protein
MTGVGNSDQSKRRILFIIVVLLALLSMFLYRKYLNQKHDNNALRLKIISMNEKKRTPKSWIETMTIKPKVVPIVTVSKINSSSEDRDITVQETKDLATQLNNQMKRVKNLNLINIDNNIALADEIISREPDSFGAYKAKLISLLIKEGKFNQPPEEIVIERLLENMAQFNLASDKLARREALLIANTNSDIQNVESQLAELSRQRVELEAQLNTLVPNSPILSILSSQLEEFDIQESQLISNIDSLQDEFFQKRALMVNEDIVEIPFMRMMAKGDLEGVVDNAETFIEEFPDSMEGYFYLVRALELQGQKEAALEVLRNSRLSQDSQQSLVQRLESQSSQDPKNYWQRLSF